MESLTRFIERRLKLHINVEKSAVARPWHRSFLGFTVRNEPEFRRYIATKAVIRFKYRMRELTGDIGASRADDPRVGPIAAGMGRLLRLQPVARVASSKPSTAGFGGVCVVSSGSSGRVADDIGNSVVSIP